MLTKDLPSDNVYAYALSKTLTKVSSPLTVGLYSSCHDRVTMILRHLEVHMEQETLRMEQRYKGRLKPRPMKPSFTGFLALIGRLLFYRPVYTEENQQSENVRFIYVHFSAWHFAGSDLLWAGLVIRLFQAMQENFGKLQLGLYRVVQHDEEEEIKKKVLEDGINDWRSKKVCCCSLWCFILFVFLGVVIIIIILSVHGFPKTEVPTGAAGETEEQTHVGVLEGLALAALGVPAASTLRFIFKMGKNLLFNQDMNIRKGLDNNLISNQLGFMNEVRKEMYLLSSFIHFMEVFERRRIRVVLKITNLDRCSPKKIVGVLEAINILLSEEDSPFVSLLAVNPEILVQQVDFADGCFCKEDRAYALLNRIVTLAFTIPPLCDASKRKVFNNLIRGQSEITEEIKMKADAERTISNFDLSHSLQEIALESAPKSKEMELLIDKKQINETIANLELREQEVERFIDSAFDSVLASDQGKLNKYILDDAMSMRRVINSIRVTVVIMEALKAELPLPEQIAAWVVLANYWPCRLSWILQCLEDDQQTAEMEGHGTDDQSKDIWEIFSDSKAELYVMREHIEDLLEQDGDPEMFEMFLKEFPFTVKDVEKFKLATVNLDSSIKKELGQSRGISRLKDFGWMRDLTPLPIKTILKMSTEDICKELESLNLPDKYADVVRNNALSGQALVFGNKEELKSLFQMTLGEWTTFRLHFLLTPSRSPGKTMQLTRSPLKNKHLHLGPQRHGSTLSLVFS